MRLFWSFDLKWSFLYTLHIKRINSILFADSLINDCHCLILWLPIMLAVTDTALLLSNLSTFLIDLSRYTSKTISISWHSIWKLLKSNLTTSEKAFWLHCRFWAMLIASVIHVILPGKHSTGGESFSRKVESVALFVLHSEPSLVAIDHSMGRSEWNWTFFISSCLVCATTAIVTTMSLSAFRVTSFSDFETADFFVIVSKNLSFTRDSVSKKRVSRSLSKRLLTNSSYAPLLIFWALQRSLMASSKGDALIETLDNYCGSRENGFSQTSLNISWTSLSFLFVLASLRSV